MESICRVQNQENNVLFSLLICLYLLLFQKALKVPLWVLNPHIGSMDGTTDIVFGNGSLNYPSRPTNSISKQMSQDYCLRPGQVPQTVSLLPMSLP